MDNKDAEDTLIEKMSAACEEIHDALFVSEQVMRVTFRRVEDGVGRYRELAKKYQEMTGKKITVSWIDAPVFPKSPKFTTDYRRAEGDKGE